MAQNIRLTITPELEKALSILRQSTMGTLNTTELIKMAVGEQAQVKKAQKSLKETYEDMNPEEMNMISAKQFYNWAKDDGSLEEDNIAHPEKLKPFIPK